MSDDVISEIETLIDRLHSQERLRVWSIVVTIFGDAVAPRGGEMWLGSLQALMDRLRIDSGAVRAAMSRLTSDGWLIRRRIGRKSYYRLADAGASEFAAAAARIYAPPAPRAVGKWRIHFLADESGEARDARRRTLRAAGFGSLGPTVFIRPEHADAPLPPEAEGEAVFSAQLIEGGDVPAFLAAAWSLDEPARAYCAFIETFTRLDSLLTQSADPDPASAMAARTLLIHDFRRAVLRDPMLPPEMLPRDWPGEAARDLAARIYARLAPPSETWLDSVGARSDGPLPSPKHPIAERFLSP